MENTGATRNCIKIAILPLEQEIENAENVCFVIYT